MRNCLEIDIIQDNRKSIKESKYSISDLNSPKCHVYNGIDVSYFFFQLRITFPSDSRLASQFRVQCGMLVYIKLNFTI